MITCSNCLSPSDCGKLGCQAELSPDKQSLLFRLRKRAEIRRNDPNRTSIKQNKPDRMADLLDEAANKIEELEKQLCME